MANVAIGPKNVAQRKAGDLNAPKEDGRSMLTAPSFVKQAGRMNREKNKGKLMLGVASSGRNGNNVLTG